MQLLSIISLDSILTQLMAFVAGDILEYETEANRNDPAGTGEGGVISVNLPYGWDKL